MRFPGYSMSAIWTFSNRFFSTFFTIILIFVRIFYTRMINQVSISTYLHNIRPFFFHNPPLYHILLFQLFFTKGFQAQTTYCVPTTCQTGHNRHLENTFEIPALYDRRYRSSLPNPPLKQALRLRNPLPPS